jgi:hypothetical protein
MTDDFQYRTQLDEAAELRTENARLLNKVGCLVSENRVLQRKIQSQRSELARLYGEVGGLAILLRQYVGDYWKLRKIQEHNDMQASQIAGPPIPSSENTQNIEQERQ